MSQSLNDVGGRLPPNQPPIPPLEPGDRLSRAEFERRYEAMPHVNKAELIEGIVYVPSPVRAYSHGLPDADFVTYLGCYRAATPGAIAADNTTARLDMDNEPQPDAMLFVEPSHGGQVKLSDDDYIEGAPELVAEIASSSVSFDLHTKFNVYRRCGVREYVAWRVADRQLDWFMFAGGGFELLAANADGTLRSRVFPGLWLDVQALLAGDLAKTLAALQSGLASPEHVDFIKRLAVH